MNLEKEMGRNVKVNKNESGYKIVVFTLTKNNFFLKVKLLFFMNSTNLPTLALLSTNLHCISMSDII